MEARPKFSRLLKSVGKLPDIPSKRKRRGRFGRSMSQLSAPVKMAYPTDGLSGQLTIQSMGSSTAKTTGRSNIQSFIRPASLPLAPN
jgi:hypothetical protein